MAPLHEEGILDPGCRMLGPVHPWGVGTQPLDSKTVGSSALGALALQKPEPL